MTLGKSAAPTLTPPASPTPSFTAQARAQTDLGAFGPKSTGAVGDAMNSAGQIAVTYLQTVGVGFYQDTAIVSSSGTVQATLPQGQGYVYGIDANGDAVGFTLWEPLGLSL